MDHDQSDTEDMQQGEETTPVEDMLQGSEPGAIPTEDGLIICIPLETLNRYAREASAAHRLTYQNSKS